MKKLIGMIAALCLLMVFFGCASDKPATAAQGGMPDWVQSARRNAPEDVIVGVGTAKMGTMNQSMNTSETRARAQIVRAMQAVVSNMMEDTDWGSEVDPNAVVSFTSNVTNSLARQTLTGARIVEQNADQTGAWWTVIYYNRSNTANTINQAAAAHRLALPAAINDMMQEKMDEKIREAAKQEWLGLD